MEEVSLQKVREAKAAMEKEIWEAADEAVERFKAATGLTPKGIDIGLHSVTPISSPAENYLITSVRTTVDVL